MAKSVLLSKSEQSSPAASFRKSKQTACGHNTSKGPIRAAAVLPRPQCVHARAAAAAATAVSVSKVAYASTRIYASTSYATTSATHVQSASTQLLSGHPAESRICPAVPTATSAYGCSGVASAAVQHTSFTQLCSWCVPGHSKATTKSPDANAATANAPKDRDTKANECTQAQH